MSERTPLAKQSTTVPSYRTLQSTAHKDTDADYHEWLGLMAWRLQMKVRDRVPQQAKFAVVLCVVFDETKNLYLTGEDPERVENDLGQHTVFEVPMKISYNDFSVRLQDFPTYVELAGKIAIILKGQKRAYWFSRKRLDYTVQPIDAAESASARIVRINGLATVFQLWVNDLETELQYGARWRENIRIHRGPAPILKASHESDGEGSKTRTRTATDMTSDDEEDSAQVMDGELRLHAAIMRVQSMPRPGSPDSVRQSDGASSSRSEGPIDTKQHDETYIMT